MVLYVRYVKRIRQAIHLEISTEQFSSVRQQAGDIANMVLRSVSSQVSHDLRVHCRNAVTEHKGGSCHQSAEEHNASRNCQKSLLSRIWLALA